MFLSHQAIDIVQKNYGGKYTPVFKTDHSPIHSGFASDALNANRMNVNPGGSQPKMRPGWFLRNGQKVIQQMIFEEGPLEGVPKGLKQVVKERYGEHFIRGIFGIYSK